MIIHGYSWWFWQNGPNHSAFSSLLCWYRTQAEHWELDQLHNGLHWIIVEPFATTFNLSRLRLTTFHERNDPPSHQNIQSWRQTYYIIVHKPWIIFISYHNWHQGWHVLKKTPKLTSAWLKHLQTSSYHSVPRSHGSTHHTFSWLEAANPADADAFLAWQTHQEKVCFCDPVLAMKAMSW